MTCCLADVIIEKRVFFMSNNLNLNSKKYDFIFKSPEIILPITFFILCLLGSLLLAIPLSHNGRVNFLDSVFTAVSAVCVTGLSVFDVGSTLTSFGQLILIVLIQLGGLGIMSISSIVFLLLGKRMSLSYAKTARNIFDVESNLEIKKSLILIFKFTFWTELIGAIILSLCFIIEEGNILYGLKLGIFSAISAFCNAGFFLKATNLISYNTNPVILYTISFLIILGGISPAVCAYLPNIIKKKKLPAMAVIVFYTTIVLLFAGTIFFLISEYNGALYGMSLADKFNNAWFQSATTRTAGFNSVDLSNINTVSYILFIFLMIIGGSPGGTAGGIKTVALGISYITLYNVITGKKNVIRNRLIPNDALQKIVTLIVFYLSILLLIILMLLTTQNISNKNLIFEAVSAMGTVGLSLGITSNLDEVGKIIIIIAMFLGRVFPVALLCYINSKSVNNDIEYPDAKISLT